MAISFKRSQAPTTTLSGTNPAAGHRRPTPPFWDSWTLIGKSGSVSCGVTAPYPGSWCTQGFISALQESVSPVLCKFWRLYSEVNDDLLQEGLCHTQVCCTQNPCPLWQATADLYLHRRHSSTQRQVWFSLCGVSWCVQGFVWAFRVSLAGMGLDSKCGFTPPTILLGLLLCHWAWSIFFWWDTPFFCWWLFSSKL